MTESLEAETSTDADKESDVSTDKEKADTSTDKKETNTVESDKKEDEKKTDDKTTEEQKTEDKKTEDKKTDNNKTDNKQTEADKKTTENTGSNSESTKKKEEHKHTWVTGYRTEEKLVHHDAVTHTETTYTTETQTIHHPGQDCYLCCDCGAQFTDLNAALAHQDANDEFSGLVSDTTDGWDEVVETQVPHTTTVVDQAAYDETVVEKIEYTYCSECGAEK